MRRREFIAVLALSTSAGPLASGAQPAGVKRVGVVYHGGAYEVMIEGLREVL